jgi:hypothetical protein
MRIEFRQGVPARCIDWLWDNVGEGNVTRSPIEPNIRRKRLIDDDWYYERERVYPQPHEAFDPGDLRPKYVPTITIKDEKKAMWFALRWSS